MEIYGSAEWYRVRPEPEKVWTGTLEQQHKAVGPATRGGLLYSLSTDRGRLDIYAAQAEDLLARMLHSEVRVRGKLVDLTGQGNGEELWIGSIELAC